MKKDSLFAGVSLTLMLHASLVFLIVARDGNTGCGGGRNDARASGFENARNIEASLAFKSAKPETKQPQKIKKKKFKPVEADPVSRDAEREPVEPKEEKERPEPDEVDIDSVLEKNRKQDEDLSDTGVDIDNLEGGPEGSEWGTAVHAKGDPYVGELHGRVKANYKVPSLETGKGVARGCVKLDEDGKIAERQLLEKSSNANLDRAVELALAQATDMEEPVPSHLSWLVSNGICFDFRL